MRTARILVAVFLALSVSGSVQIPGQSDIPDDLEGILNQYISTGLKNNLALKQEHFSLEKSLQALREARGMFLPRVLLEARYSLADGGRMIEIPVGDLMNPVYNTLNELLGLHDQAAVFPAGIDNEAIPFLRPQEQDTKLRIIQPMFHPEMYHLTKIKLDLSRIQRSRMEAFKRQLVRDIKTAYFTSQKAVKVVELLLSIRDLLRENLRVSTSLFENQKVTEEVVFRARADLTRMDQKIAEAEKNKILSASYFNFLLNRPLDAPIKPTPEDHSEIEATPDLERLVGQAIEHRQEFFQLNRALDAARREMKLHGSRSLPTLTAVLDYGFQGERYRFSGEDDYWMASLVLSWNIFNGFQDNARVAQARMDLKRIQAGYAELEQKIRMEVRQAFENLAVAKKALDSAREQLKSTESAFRIVSRKYEEGMVPQIEYIQARDEFIRAGIENILAVFDIHICRARLEYASASIRFTE